jgi:hypothetical protein
MKPSSVKIINGDTVITISTGGVAYAEIRKDNGEVLKVTHGK